MAPNRVRKTPPVTPMNTVASPTVNVASHAVMFYPSYVINSNRVTEATPLWESVILGFTYRRLYRRPRVV